MDTARNFRDVVAWQKAHQLVLQIYPITKLFPDDEKFGLIAQLRRAAVSVPANIAEGFVRHGQRDKIHFYNIAQGSLEESKYYLMLARDLGYTKDVNAPAALAEDVGRLLHGLIRSIQPHP